MTVLSPAAVIASNYPGIQGRIVFVSDRDGNREIYIMNPDGLFLQRLTNNSTQEDTPAVSPDGTQIAFVSQPLAGVSTIWVMNADGSNPIQLTAATADSYEPDWSPDGSTIAFSTRLGGPDLQIYTMNADGTNQTPLITVAGSGMPSWSPDGTKIAYTQATGSGAFDVFSADADGNNPVQLTTNPAGKEAEFPNWSPDGTRIVFDSRDPGDGDVNINIMDSNGTNRIPLTDIPFAYRATWSPDGSRIVYSGALVVGMGFDQYSINPDGSGTTNLTNGDGVIRNDAGFWSIITPLVVPPPLGGPPTVPGSDSSGGAGSNGELAATGTNLWLIVTVSVAMIGAAIGITGWRASSKYSKRG